MQACMVSYALSGCPHHTYPPTPTQADILMLDCSDPSGMAERGKGAAGGGGKKAKEEEGEGDEQGA